MLLSIRENTEDVYAGIDIRRDSAEAKKLIGSD